MAGHVMPGFGVLNNARVSTSDVRRRNFANFVGNNTVLGQITNVLGNGPWEGIRYLGVGASGRAAVFGRFDAAGVLQDRVVLKEIECTVDKWLNPLYWAPVAANFDANNNRDYDTGIDHSESAESFIHRKVSVQDADSIVGYRGRSIVSAGQWRYRIFTEYGCLGTLSDVINFYRDPNNFPDARVSAAGLPDVTIPEPFIWYCVLQLVTAAKIMERGTVAAGPIPGWKEVIHRDIKPSNIWLYDPPTAPGTQWRVYPKPKLGDWGIAVETTSTESAINNPRIFRDEGTAGFVAPEAFPWHRVNTRGWFDRPRLNAATNVWAIGMIIYCLVYRIPQPPQLDPSHRNPIKPPRPEGSPEGPLPRNATTNGDSWKILTGLMWECLSFAPNERPSLDYISDLCLKRPRKNALPEHFQKMHTCAPAVGQRWYNFDNSNTLAMDFDDEYRVGLNRANLPALGLPPWE